jgi:N-sulfoglucosamine sulfohydrolase
MRTLLFLACGLLLRQLPAPGQPARPNIVWITCEDSSPCVGAYDNTLVKTPNIDQLTGEGVGYTQAYTAAGVCAPIYFFSTAECSFS